MKFSFTVVLGALAFSLPALGQAPDPTKNGEVADACRIDVKTHCGGTEKKAVGKCLHDHEKDLTPPCQEHLKERQAKAANDLKSASPMDKAGALFQIPGSP